MSADPSMVEHDKCVAAAKQSLFTWAGIFSTGFAGGWYVAGKASPRLAAVNWRVKAISSCVSVIALSYYRGERALVDCTFERANYEMAAKAARREQRMKKQEE